MSEPGPGNGQWAPRFFAVWGAESLAVVGNRLVQFALVWWITSTTGSAAALASATFFVMLPNIVLGPFIGALVDRFDRRKLMIAADIAMVAASAVLAYVAWAGRLAVWHVYALALVRSTAAQFGSSALISSTSLMVPGRHLTRVAGMNQLVQGVMSIAAPALGAIMVTYLPLHSTILAQICLAALAVLILALSRIPQPGQRDAASGTTLASLARDVRDGFRFVWSWKGMAFVLVASTLMNMVFNPIGSLMPLFVTKHLGGTAVHLGWLESAMGAGMIAGSLLLGVWGGFRRRIYTAILGLLGMAVGTLVMGLTPERGFAIAVVGMLITGLNQPLSNGPLFAIMQATVPANLQGRVFTVLGSVNQVAAPVGLLLAAPVADLLGLRAWYLIAAVLALGIGLAMPLVPSVRHLEEGPGWRPARARRQAGLATGGATTVLHEVQPVIMEAGPSAVDRAAGRRSRDTAAL